MAPAYVLEAGDQQFVCTLYKSPESDKNIYCFLPLVLCRFLWYRSLDNTLRNYENIEDAKEDKGKGGDVDRNKAANLKVD